MKDTTIRGLNNAMSALLSSPEFDRVRIFLVADASADKPEAEEIIRAVVDQVRAHLLEHGRQVRAIAAKGKAV